MLSLIPRCLSASLANLFSSKSRLDMSNKRLLHGFLSVEIIEARNLPEMESWVTRCFSPNDTSDPMVEVFIDHTRIIKSAVISNDLNPIWDEDYRVEVCHMADSLVFHMVDKDHIGTDSMGTVSFSVGVLLSGDLHEGWFPIMSDRDKHHGDIHLKVQFVSKSSIERSYEVEGAYFPMQSNCQVTLYQDTVTPADLSPFQDILRADGSAYQPHGLWRDVYEAIKAAEHLICITGWSVWDKLQLLRGEDAEDTRTLGEILIEKANQGCQVQVLIWSEFTSGDLVGDNGLMGTHDMETYRCFKGTRVRCVLATREVSVKEVADYYHNQVSSGTYSHHQKSIICDAEWVDHDQRRLVAFVGGLDLTNGRYDSPDHQLYESIGTDHLGDFHNGYCPTIPATEGPREPWHDIHSRVEGPIAHDVFQNFLERWQAQGEGAGHILDPIDEELIHIGGPDPDEEDRSPWNVQLFRSITSDSARFHPNRVKRLSGKKGRKFEASIAQAHVQMIRNAEHFIYIENQYFLGSAYCWLKDDKVNCHHTIPSEITQKIIDKIHLGESFCAYIVVPMMPEGDPTTSPIQEILFWQRRTMEMMYHRIGLALIDNAREDSHPHDWLQFLCLGKRELPGPHLDQLDPPTHEFAQNFRKSLAFPIYVHSKMMIVDDVYAIVGSANINQRSMSGTRDTELAVGCWQPDHALDQPEGEVHLFRMSLFAAHFRMVHAEFKSPGTLSCSKMIQGLCSLNWEAYISAESPSSSPGFMLPYPISIQQDGTLKRLEEFSSFPGFPKTATVFGGSGFMPDKLTT